MMGKVAYRIDEAAAAASVQPSDIEAAIKGGDLMARAIRDTYIILRSDLESYLTRLPEFYSVNEQAGVRS